MAKKKGFMAEIPEAYQKNCIIYTRISDPNKQTEVSLEAQERECREFAAKHGLRVIGTLEDMSTGRNMDRPKFIMLKELARRHNFRYVLVWRYDRFSRSQDDTFAAIGYFRQHGVSLIPIKEQESLEPSPQERFLAGMYIAMAELYSSDLSIKVCRNMYHLAKQGLYYGGSPGYGYKIENKTLVEDPETSYVVKTAFRMYADGHGTKEICQKINEEGYRTSKGKPFNVNGLRNMLSNEKYIGVYSYNATDPDGNKVNFRFEHKIPALIDEETFRRVQDRLVELSRGPGSAKAKVPYLLQGKIICGLCGNPMRSESGNKPGVTYRYYSCRKDNKGNKCTRKRLTKDVIECNVAMQVVMKLMDKDYVAAVEKVLKERAESPRKRAELTALSQQVTKLTKMKKTLANSLIDDEIGEKVLSPAVRKVYEERLENVVNLLDSYENRVVSLKLSMRADAAPAFDLDDWLSDVQNYNVKSFEARQHIISKYVKQVIVYEDSMEVILLTPDEVGCLEDIDETICCERAYYDFKDQYSNITIPEELNVTDEEAAEVMNSILKKKLEGEDDDDDPDPDGSGGGGKSGGGKLSGSGGKSTRPYNTKETDISSKNAVNIDNAKVRVWREPVSQSSFNLNLLKGQRE